jgi:hypothetical protein
MLNVIVPNFRLCTMMVLYYGRNDDVGVIRIVKLVDLTHVEGGRETTVRRAQVIPVFCPACSRPLIPDLTNATDGDSCPADT